MGSERLNYNPTEEREGVNYAVLKMSCHAEVHCSILCAIWLLTTVLLRIKVEVPIK